MKRFIRLFHSLSLEKGLSFVTIGYFVSTGLGALLWFILAAEMTANDYGSLNYYVSITTIFATVGMMGFETTLTTYLAKGVVKMLPESTSITWIAGIILSVILSFIFKSFSIVLVFLGTLFFILSLAEVLGKRHYKEYMILLIAQKTITVVFVPFLFAIHGVDGALYGYAISYMPLCYRFFISSRKLSFSISTLRPIKNFFVHSYALGISRVLVMFSDKLIIAPLFGIAIVGYYQFGIQMLTTVSVIPLVLYHYLLPQEAGGLNINERKMGRLGILSSVIVTAFLITLTPTIVAHLFPKFENAVLSSQIVILAGIPMSMTAIYTSFLMARENSFYVLVASGTFLVVQYVLIGSLGWVYGLVGLSLSTVIAAAVQSVFLFIIKRKVSMPASKII